MHKQSSTTKIGWIRNHSFMQHTNLPKQSWPRATVVVRPRTAEKSKLMMLVFDYKRQQIDRNIIRSMTKHLRILWITACNNSPLLALKSRVAYLEWHFSY